MTEELSTLYRSITGRIHAVSAAGPTTTACDAQDPWQTALPLAALRSLRIQVMLQMISQGYREGTAALREDFSLLHQELRQLTLSQFNSSASYFDAADAALLTDPGQRRLLLSQLGFGMRMRIHAFPTLRLELFTVLLEMAMYYLQIDMEDTCHRAIQNILQLSKERNSQRDHRNLIRAVLERLVDVAPAISREIYLDYNGLFRGDYDEDAVYFYWCGGCAMRASGEFQLAAEAFRTCHRLSRHLEGEDFWITALSKQAYSYLDLIATGDPEAEAYLFSFLERVESGFFSDVPEEVCHVVAAETLGQLISVRLHRKDMAGMFPYLQKYLHYCQEFDQDPRYPIAKLRRAYTELAGYYTETGEYLQAAEYANLALGATMPPGTPVLVTDCDLITNLLLIYCTLYDRDKIAHYRDLLVDALEQGNADTDLFRAHSIVDLANFKLGFKPWYNPGRIRQRLLQFHQAVAAGALENEETARQNAAMWCVNAIDNLLNGVLSGDIPEGLSQEETARYRALLLRFLEEPREFPLLDNHTTLVYLSLARLCWISRDPQAITWVDKCLESCHRLSRRSEEKTTILRICATILHSFHRTERAGQLARQVLDGLTEAWQKATSYLNDNRVCQVLSYAGLTETVCYSILWPNLTHAGPCIPPLPRMGFTGQYEHVLQFKDLPALVSRERSRILRSRLVDETLKQQIFTLQNKIAEAEAGILFRDGQSLDTMYRELQTLEAEFSRKFPEVNRFTDITYQNLAKAMPDRSAIVEYHIALNDDEQYTNLQKKATFLIEIFSIYKEGERKYCGYHTISDAAAILEAAKIFQSILLGDADTVTAGRKEQLRTSLYNALIAPVIGNIQECQELFIAPDTQLCNLPFEILSDSSGTRLADRFRISRLVCGRDLLFDDGLPPAPGALIIGGPDYEVPGSAPAENHSRQGQPELTPVTSLPFSAIEAQRIGRRCRTQSFTGRAATKYQLQNSGPRGIIHLATHGFFDTSLQANSLYASCLVFAGFNQWLRSGVQTREWGNGLLTADEISRMDLRRTELVVLSACRSGMGDGAHGTVQGLLSGFSAAGVRWVVSHIWDADDFVTPIFMDAFYHGYLDLRMQVPEALQYAKAHIRTVTVGQLRREGWLNPDSQYPGRETGSPMLDWLRTCDDRVRPFLDEYYWGGFVCHRCK